MDRYKETFDTWNKLASLYEKKFMNLDLYNVTYDSICNAIRIPNAKLLEIGCGPGNITKYLLTKRPDFDIFGIDIAPNMVELAKLNNPTAHFVVMDSRQIYQLDTKYDGIIVGFCLPYLSQSESKDLIINAYDLLNDQGLLYLSFVEGDPKQSDYIVGSGGRVYFNFHNVDALISHLIEKGFGQIETSRLKYPASDTEVEIHTILTAKKLVKKLK